MSKNNFRTFCIMTSMAQIKLLIFSTSGIIDLLNIFLEVNYASITL